MNIAIFDTETTGLINGELMELACLYYNDNDSKEYVFKMKPESKVMPASTAIHGIEQKVADTYQDAKIVTKEIYDTFISFERPTVFVAHNILFDNNIVNNNFKKYLDAGFEPKQSIDTVRFAKHLIPSADIGGYKLDGVFYYLYPDKLSWLIEQRAIHDALTDCKITKLVLNKLKLLLENEKGKSLTYEEVIDYVNQPIDMSDEMWAFGKHKGMLIKDTPRGYINWCLSSDFGQDPKNADLVYTMKNL